MAQLQCLVASRLLDRGSGIYFKVLVWDEWGSLSLKEGYLERNGFDQRIYYNTCCYLLSI